MIDMNSEAPDPPVSVSLLDEICDRWGSPIHLLAPQVFRWRCEEVARRLKSMAGICYSVKANPWLVEQAKSLCDCVETCSTGEVRLCLAAGVEPDLICGGAVCMGLSDFEAQIALGVSRFSIESRQQAQTANEAAQRAGTTLSVTLRLSSGNQFGMSIEALIALCKESDDLANLEIDGIRFYAGTQRRSADAMSKSMAQIRESIGAIESHSGRYLRRLQFGPGLGVPYFLNDSPARYQDAVESFFAGVEALSEGRSLVVELGRYLVAGSGRYVSRVVDIKPKGRAGWFVILDGGRNHLDYHGYAFGARTPLCTVINRHPDTAVLHNAVGCGALCTASDVLVTWKEVRLGVGDFVVFENTGAYSLTEAPALFLSRDLAPVVEIEGAPRLRRPTVETWNLNFIPTTTKPRDGTGNE